MDVIQHSPAGKLAIEGRSEWKERVDVDHGLTVDGAVGDQLQKQDELARKVRSKREDSALGTSIDVARGRNRARREETTAWTANIEFRSPTAGGCGADRISQDLGAPGKVIHEVCEDD